MNALSWNKVVAFNLARFRKFSGMSQEEFGEQMGRLTGGKPWSTATVSAAERSLDSDTRVRKFDANEITAFALVLDQPVESFFTLPKHSGQIECFDETSPRPDAQHLNRTDVEREQDLATRLRIPMSTWRAMRKQGRGPEHFRIGRRIYYAPEAVETWLKEQASGE